MIIISRMMEDLIIFTLPELGYFSLDESYTTGSSIMPQKMNPDVIEIIKSKSAKLLGKFVELATSMKALPSDYNRDSALSKAIIIESFQEVITVLDILIPMLETLTPNEEVMKKATIPTLATNLVDFLVKKHQIPFRTAHKIIGKALAFVDYDITKINQNILKNASLSVTNKSIIVNDSEINSILNVDNLLDKFSYPGSPNPVFVEGITNRLLKQNNDFSRWLKDQEKVFSNSQKELKKKVKKYITQK